MNEADIRELEVLHRHSIKLAKVNYMLKQALVSLLEEVEDTLEEMIKLSEKVNVGYE